VNTVAMPEPVLRSPALSLSSQPCLGAGTATSAKTWSACTCEGAVAVAAKAAATVAGDASVAGVGDFLRKKLNMGSFLNSLPFYEIGEGPLVSYWLPS